LKRISGWLIVIALFGQIMGCGGGGGGGSSASTGGTTGALHSLQATLYLQPSNTMLDPRSLLVGDQGQLEITGRDSNNNLVVVAASGWATNAPPNVATISSGGAITANGASTSTYTISVKYGGLTYSASLAVAVAQSIVTGVVNNGTNAVQFAAVDIFNASGTSVGTAYTARDGTFRASVPSTATQFTVDMAVADPGNTIYFDVFAYGPASNIAVYLENKACLANLPALTAGGATPLASAVVLYPKSTGLPPPPPTGCLG